MPAETEELEWLFEEGNELIELAAPTRVILKEGRVVGLERVRNELGEPGPDGRRRPEPVPGSEFEIEASAVILAIGQQPDLSFLDGSTLTFHRDGRIDRSRNTQHATRSRLRRRRRHPWPGDYHRRVRGRSPCCGGHLPGVGNRGTRDRIREAQVPRAVRA